MAATRAAKTKAELWESSLLDLTVRNSLLSMRLGQRLTPIPVQDIGSLEDMLADGNAFKLLPRPEDVAAPEKLAIDELGDIEWDPGRLKGLFSKKSVPTYLSEKAFEKTIKSLHRKSVLSIEETGSNTLFLALGSLRWRRSETDAFRHAPLVMVPVEIVRLSAKQGYALAARDEESQINITLLELLRREYGIEVKGLDPLPEDEHGLDMPLILETFRKHVKPMREWSVEETALIGLFSFSQFVMWKDIRDNAALLERNKVVKSLAAGKLKWKPKPLEEGDRINPFDTLLPVAADASQVFAIKSASSGESFVLHGPPGSGKSQTITGIIANALADGRRVLFVAEKAAALNVVYDRLERLGLGAYCLELHSNKATKSHVLDQLQRASDAAIVKKSEYGPQLSRTKLLAEDLDEYATALYRVQPCGLTLRELVSRYIEWEDAPGAVELDYKSTDAISGIDQLDARFRLIEQMAAAVSDMGNPSSHPLREMLAVHDSYALARELPSSLESYKVSLEILRFAFGFDLPELPPALPAGGPARTRFADAQLGFAEEVYAVSEARQDQRGASIAEAAKALSKAAEGAIFAFSIPMLEGGLPKNPFDDEGRAFACAAKAYSDAVAERLREGGLPEATGLSMSAIRLAEAAAAFREVAAIPFPSTTEGLDSAEDSISSFEYYLEALAVVRDVPGSWLGADEPSKLAKDVKYLCEKYDSLERLEGQKWRCSVASAKSLDPDSLLSEWGQAKSAGIFKKKKAIASFLEKLSSYSVEPVAESDVASFVSYIRSLKEAALAFDESLEGYIGYLDAFSRPGGYDWVGARKAAMGAQPALERFDAMASKPGCDRGKLAALAKRMASDPSLLDDLGADVSKARSWLTNRNAALENVNSSMRALSKGIQDAHDASMSALAGKRRDLDVLVRDDRERSLLEFWEALAPLAPVMESKLAGVPQVVDEFDYASWSSGVDGELASLGRISENLDLLHEWNIWKTMSDEAEKMGLRCVVNALSTFDDPADVMGAYRKSLYRYLCERAIASDDSTNRFNGTVFDRKIKHYEKADGLLRELAKEEAGLSIAKRVPNLAERAAANSEMSFLKRAIRSKGRGVTIRRLFREAHGIVNKLCPCMLMSPLSVAQYIDLSNEPFDLVVFDEASQIETCKAVGAIARGKNVVVVGDPNQMPPTTFFRSQIKDDDIDDVADLESILEDCLALDMPEAHLRWHYRSQHESLIAFSNGCFYGGGLYTFPSADDADRRVTLRHVDGAYEGAGANYAEARAIVDEVKRRSTDPVLSQRSLGIVTFSSKQQGIVEDLLDRAYYEDSNFEKWALGGEEPLFVKNLENVQGDERDAVLFSVAYGPDSTGRFRMQFGPLNNEGGWRRLNVAVTRARQEMVVFTVIDPSDMNDEKITSKGVRALKGFLRFAATGKAPEEGSLASRPADAIADSVARMLESRGYDVRREIGSSAFKVDIGVVDPANPGRYAVGILLDAESYGAAKTTRDREIGRQEMLRSLGWNIATVWTMDWWLRRGHIEEMLVDFVKGHVSDPGVLRASGNAEREPKADANSITSESDLYVPSAFSDEPERADENDEILLEEAAVVADEPSGAPAETHPDPVSQPVAADDGLAALLEAAGFECFDKRPEGGGLFVVGDKNDGSRIEEIAGVDFSFNKRGNKFTSFRSAWWTRSTAER